MTKKTIIGDSCLPIALPIIQQLELLSKLYQGIVIPHKIWEEITIHGAGLPSDVQGHRVAEGYCANRIGTLGILRRAKKGGLVNTIEPYIVFLYKTEFLFDFQLVSLNVFHSPAAIIFY